MINWHIPAPGERWATLKALASGLMSVLALAWFLGWVVYALDVPHVDGGHQWVVLALPLWMFLVWRARPSASRAALNLRWGPSQDDPSLSGWQTVEGQAVRLALLMDFGVWVWIRLEVVNAPAGRRGRQAQRPSDQTVYRMVRVDDIPVAWRWRLYMRQI